MTRWTEEDLKNIQGDAEVRGQKENKRTGAIKGIAKGSTPRGEMNKTEQRWATLLDHSEDVLWWAYEVQRVRYGHHGWHTPDFTVIRLDGKMEIHEVKAHMTEGGRTRFKAGAKAFPVARWLMVQQKSPQRPWEVIYDTAGEDGRPFIQSD